LRENILIDTIQRNTKALLDAGKEIGLEVNSDKTKYMLMSRKKAGQKHSIKIVNRSFEGIIIIISFYSLVEHRARVKICHLVLFAAKAFTSAQLFFSGFNSFSTVRRHVVLGRPLFQVPCGFHSSASLEILLGGFLSVCL
jgi:hypothetical protein